jgi:transcriptional regulator with XRE-family HTH domain
MKMARILDEFLAGLPKAQQEEIQRQGAALIAEERSLRELRKMRRLSQAELAKRLNLNQGAISKIESRADLLLSTLRSFVEAAGGTLELVARFPDAPPVKIARLKDLSSRSRAEPSGSQVTQLEKAGRKIA